MTPLDSKTSNHAMAQVLQNNLNMQIIKTTQFPHKIWQKMAHGKFSTKKA